MHCAHQGAGVCAPQGCWLCAALLVLWLVWKMELLRACGWQCSMGMRSMRALDLTHSGTALRLHIMLQARSLRGTQVPVLALTVLSPSIHRICDFCHKVDNCAPGNFLTCSTGVHPAHPSALQLDRASSAVRHRAIYGAPTVRSHGAT